MFMKNCKGNALAPQTVGTVGPESLRRGLVRLQLFLNSAGQKEGLPPVCLPDETPWLPVLFPDHPSPPVDAADRPSCACWPVVPAEPC